MLQYPSINKQIINVPVYAFDKLDDRQIDKMVTLGNSRNTMESKDCEHCLKEFAPKKITQKFCKRECFVAHQKASWATQKVLSECDYCGVQVERPQSQATARKLYCSIEHKQLGSRRGWETRECRACGVEFRVRIHDKPTHCSVLHSQWTRTEHSLLLLPMRLAWENNPASFLNSVREHCQVTDEECWQPNWTDEHYPYFTLPGISSTQLHRITLTFWERPPKDSVEQAHHTCANPRCVNPEHLQWLAPHDNLAEMKERGRYLLRIQRLESALFKHEPNHPLLKNFTPKDES